MAEVGDGIDRSHFESPESLRVERTKIVQYLLNTEHPQGAGKAKFFCKLGFSVEEWNDFADALRDHAGGNEIANVENGDYGTKYVIECNIDAPGGNHYCIRVVWNDHRDGEPPKLITAHPLSPRTG